MHIEVYVHEWGVACPCYDNEWNQCSAVDYPLTCPVEKEVYNPNWGIKYSIPSQCPLRTEPIVITLKKSDTLNV